MCKTCNQFNYKRMDILSMDFPIYPSQEAETRASHYTSQIIKYLIIYVIKCLSHRRFSILLKQQIQRFGDQRWSFILTIP